MVVCAGDEIGSAIAVHIGRRDGEANPVTRTGRVHVLNRVARPDEREIRWLGREVTLHLGGCAGEFVRANVYFVKAGGTDHRARFAINVVIRRVRVRAGIDCRRPGVEMESRIEVGVDDDVARVERKACDRDWIIVEVVVGRGNRRAPCCTNPRCPIM